MSLKLPVIRLALDLDSLGQLRDAVTGRGPMLAQGASTRIQLGLFNGGALADVSAVTRVSATFVPLRRGGDGPALDATPYLIAGTTTLDATADAATWADGSKQHAELTIDAELLLPMGRCWVSFSALDNFRSVHLGGGYLDVYPHATGQLEIVVTGDPADYRLSVYDDTLSLVDLNDHPDAEIVFTLLGTGLVKTLSGGDITLEGSGTALVTLTPADTNALSPGSYRPFAKWRPSAGAAYETVVAGGQPLKVASSPLRNY